MAAMLIRYKQREARERTRRVEVRERECEQGDREGQRAAGAGALVLAAATRHAGTGEERTGVVGAVYVPPGSSMGEARERSEAMAFWCADAKGHGEEGMEEMLEWMDRAGAIVMYEAEWMRTGMRGIYGGDEERRASHLRKIVDVGEHVRRAQGRVVRESSYLSANGQGRRAGTRCDVDGAWEKGRIEVVRDACMRDARAMAEVALARAMRGTDGREIGAVKTARAAVLRGEGDAGGDDEQAADTQRGAPRQESATRLTEEMRSGEVRRGKRTREGGDRGEESRATARDSARAVEAAEARTEEGDEVNGIESATPHRPKRTGAATASYVYTRQYNKRAKKEGYMLRNGQAHVLGKRAMEVGPATVERATRGRYDWQDGGLRKRKRADEVREEGERRLRPRDPGKKGRHT